MSDLEKARKAYEHWSNIALEQDPTACTDYIEALQAELAKAREAALEEAARIAERDVDWTRFGKRDLKQWEGGADSARDYRLGIRAGRAIAAAIRAVVAPSATTQLVNIADEFGERRALQYEAAPVDNQPVNYGESGN